MNRTRDRLGQTELGSMRGKERQLGAELKLQESLRQRSQYLARLSHELRNPLNAILGFCQILLKSPETGPTQVESLLQIQSQGRQILNVLSDVVEFSRLEAGQFHTQARPIRLADILQELQTQLAPAIAGAGRELQLECDCPPLLLGDGDKLQQLLLNLGWVSHRLQRQGDLYLSLNYRGGLLQATWFNDRLQLEPASLAQLFQPFYFPENASGSGLELALCREVAQRLGGRLEAQPQDQGLIFQLRLPMEHGQDSESSPSLPAILGLHPQQPPVKVLIVDDVAVNRLLLLRFLQPLGFEVRESDSGRGLLEQFQSWQPQVILSDLVMPDLHGLEAIRRLRQLPGGEQALVVAISGTGPAQGPQGGALGPNHLLSKPVDLSQLLQILIEGLKLRVVHRPSTPSENPPEPGPWALPNPQLLQALKAAAALGDVRAVELELHDLAQGPQELTPLLRRCWQLFDHYEFRRLEELIDHGSSYRPIGR